MNEDNKEIKQTSADYKPEVVHHPDLPQNNSSNLINSFLDNNTLEKFEQNEKVAQPVQPTQNVDILMNAEPTSASSNNTSIKDNNIKLERLKKAMYLSIGLFVVSLVIIILSYTGLTNILFNVKGFSYFILVLEAVYQYSKIAALGLSIAGTICFDEKDRKNAIIASIAIIAYILITPVISTMISSYLISGVLGI